MKYIINHSDNKVIGFYNHITFDKIGWISTCHANTFINAKTCHCAISLALARHILRKRPKSIISIENYNTLKINNYETT